MTTSLFITLSDKTASGKVIQLWMGRLDGTDVLHQQRLLAVIEPVMWSYWAGQFLHAWGSGYIVLLSRTYKAFVLYHWSTWTSIGGGLRALWCMLASR